MRIILYLNTGILLLILNNIFWPITKILGCDWDEYTDDEIVLLAVSGVISVLIWPVMTVATIIIAVLNIIDLTTRK